MNRPREARPRLIIYSEVAWGFLDQRHHHLARFFAKEGFSVEFVERVVNRVPPPRELGAGLWARLKERIGLGQAPTPRKAVPEAIQLRRSRFLPQAYRLCRPLNYLYWVLFERRRQRGAVLYSFVDNPVLFGGALARLRTDKLAIFDIIHNWWAFPWHRQYHHHAVAQMLALADKVVIDSLALRERHLPLLASAHLMLPGVSEAWTHGEGAELPLPDASPRAAFFGNLRSNSDLPFVEAVAEAIGLDLFGLLAGDAAAHVPSVRCLGQVAAEALPERLAPYNVLVLPYNRDAFSATIAPAKYFEALATGALIITRAPLAHLPGFDRFCLLVDDQQGDELAELLRRRLAAHLPNIAAQREFARQHSWSARFSALRELAGV
jgi:hypothetical protein